MMVQDMLVEHSFAVMSVVNNLRISVKGLLVYIGHLGFDFRWGGFGRYFGSWSLLCVVLTTRLRRRSFGEYFKFGRIQLLMYRIATSR
jgi:hypothetical protein